MSSKVSRTVYPTKKVIWKNTQEKVATVTFATLQMTDLTSVPLGHKLEAKSSREEAAGSSPDSFTQIQRYLRLNYLNPELMDFVDEGKIAMHPAVELSYLDEEAQRDVVDIIDLRGVFPSPHAQAIRMRKAYSAGELDHNKVSRIMAEEKPNQKPKMKISYDRLKQLIPSSYTPSMAEEYIIKALEYYHRYLQRQRDKARQ